MRIHPWTAAGLPLVAAAAAVLLWFSWPLEDVARFASEEGPVELLTPWLYYAMAVVFAVSDAGRAATRASLAVVMVAFGMREMDLHKAWTEISVLKGNFYLSHAPLHQKLIAGAVVVAVGLAMLVLVWRHALPVWQRLRRADPVAVTTVVFVLTLVLGKIFLDRSLNILHEDYGVQVSRSVHVLVGAVEEIVELTLPVLAGLGWWQHRLQKG